MSLIPLSGRVPLKGDWMQNYRGFERKELSKIGVVCQKCGTEVIFDLDKEPTSYASTSCPSCNAEGFMQVSAGFGANRYNIVTAQKMLRDMQLNSEIRLYFEEPMRSTPQM